jgi:hypothetical protein
MPWNNINDVTGNRRTKVDTSAGGLLVPEGIIRPVVSVSALTWFIRYTVFITKIYSSYIM